MTPEIEAGLCALVATLTGLECVMLDAERPAVDDDTQAIALLQIYAVTPLGSAPDESSWTEAPADWVWGSPWGGTPPPLVQTIRGQREFTLRVRVEAYDQTQPARLWAERLRLRLSFASSIATLRGLGLAFRETLALTDVSEPFDDRIRPFAFLDVRFGAVAQETDTVTLPTIESVIVRKS